MTTDLRHFRIGSWEVDCHLGTLISANSRRRLPPKLIGLLQQLAYSPGELVSREKLLETVWEGAVVNEEAVSRAVAELRQALGDDARTPAYIETVPKRGYRLIQPVEPVDEPVRSLKKPLWIGFSILVVTLLLFQWSGGRLKSDSTPLWPDEVVAVPITSDEGWEGYPAVSSEGQWIIFAKPDASGQSDLWLVNTTTLDRRRLTDDTHMETNPVFSPDATQVAFRQLTQDKCRVIVYALLDGKTRPVAECHPQLQGLDWSHDARELLFLSRVEEGSAITSLNLADGSTTAIVINDGRSTDDGSPKYSPDGNWITFTRGTRSRRELYRVSTAGGELQQLTNDGQYVTGHAWLKGDIVFSSDRLGSRQLWYLNTDNHKITSLGFSGARQLSTSKDGTKMAFESAHFIANIYRLELDDPDHSARKVISSSAYDNYPALSPGDDLLAYISNRSGFVSIWMARENGEHGRMLLQQQHSRITDPAWSVDGKRLLATRHQQGISQILEVSPETGQSRVLSDAGVNVYGARFSGPWIYFIDGDGKEPMLARIAANGQGTVEATGVVANRAIPGGNGLMYFTRPTHDGIFEFNPGNGSEKEIVSDMPVDRWQSWTVRPPWLVYIRSVSNGGHVVVRLNLENNSDEIVSTFSPDTVGGSIEISADGNILFVARTDRADLDIKMIDLSE